MLRVRNVSSIFLVLLGVCTLAVAQRSVDDATERRINELVKQMTVDEKVGQLVQLSGESNHSTPHLVELVSQGKVGSLLNVVGAEETNAVQKIAVEQSRLKIPLIIGYDVIHGFRTTFPLPIA